MISKNDDLAKIDLELKQIFQNLMNSMSAILYCNSMVKEIIKDTKNSNHSASSKHHEEEKILY
ncbi:MAG: hypothetical protein HQK51_21740 [Oligoflexia bacterium]|nr:hypothetical protein [Oligoflexia bacterium]